MIKPLGPDGVQARVSELRSRIETLRGAAPEGFSAVLDRANLHGAPLSGTIDNAENGFAPLRPDTSQIGLPNGLNREQIKSMIARTANAYGINPHLFDALVSTESGYNPLARSNAGAIGLAQLMPVTAQGLGVDPYNPSENLRGGAIYLKQMLEQFDSVELALAAYNAGPNAVKRAGGIPQNGQTPDYVNRIMTKFRARSGE